MNRAERRAARKGGRRVTDREAWLAAVRADPRVSEETKAVAAMIAAQAIETPDGLLFLEPR